jgi:IS5 family transposase
MDRNYLKGTEGDRINAILAGCGANFRKLIKAFLCPFFEIRRILEKITRNYQRTSKTGLSVLIHMV